jgi:hypothetical protein
MVMGQTIRQNRDPSYEFWSARPHNSGGAPANNYTKKYTIRTERQMSKKLTTEELESLQPWQHVLECDVCGDYIYSKHSGQWTPCSCGTIFVDSTPHYSRYGGSKFKRINPNE